MSVNVRKQGTSITERRLRPIYDCLDMGNNKRAVQEAEKVLKKSPDLHCAKALKCLANIRLGKEDEALEMLYAVVEEQPSDDATLQAMKICYRELGKLDKICEFYEAAVKKDPGNEELLTHLFMAYVRTGNFEKQQHTATILYKLKPKNPYYFWGVMSIVLQVTVGAASDDPVKKELLLSLAQRRVDKFIEENKMEAEQEANLYLMILELRNKYSEAIEFLQSPIGKKLIPGTLAQVTLPYLEKLQSWSQVNLFSKHLIWTNPDRWDYHMTYLQSCLKLFEKKAAEESQNESNNVAENSTKRNNVIESVDDTAEKCYEFLKYVIDNNTEMKTVSLRGPYLSVMEMYKQFTEKNIDVKNRMNISLPELLTDYYKRFGHKGCCMSDLKSYMSLLSEEEGSQLADNIVQIVGIGPEKLPGSEDEMQRHISSIQLSRMFGKHNKLSVEHIQTLIATLALHCEYANFKAPRSITERAPADQYGLVAAHLYYDIALKTISTKPLVEAIHLLEYVVQNSPSNYHCKLFCIKLYHLLGCGLGAQAMYDSLDIKQIQLDSLGYIHCARIFSTGLLSVTKEMFKITMRFFSTYSKESVDHVTFSYKYGSFMKLRELMDCRVRILDSLHGSTVFTEQVMLDLMLSANHSAALKSLTLSEYFHDVEWEALRDNRDLSVNVCWDPVLLENRQLKEQTFEHEKNYYKMKLTILECLLACTEIPGSESEEKISVLVERIDKLKELFKELTKEAHQPINIDSVAAPLSSRIIGFLNSRMPLKEAYVSSFEFFLTFVRKTDMQSAVEVFVEETFNVVCECAKEQSKMKDGYWNIKNTFEEIVNCLELISIICCMLGKCQELSKQPVVKKTKKKGASSQHPADMPLKPLFHLCEVMHTGLGKLIDLLNAWSPSCTNLSDLATYFATLSINTKEDSPVMMRLQQSYAKSITELIACARDKVKYLISLGIRPNNAL